MSQQNLKHDGENKDDTTCALQNMIYVLQNVIYFNLCENISYVSTIYKLWQVLRKVNDFGSFKAWFTMGLLSRYAWLTLGLLSR